MINENAVSISQTSNSGHRKRAFERIFLVASGVLTAIKVNINEYTAI